MRKLTLLISATLIVASLSNCNQSDKKESDGGKSDSTNTTKPAVEKIVVDGSCEGVSNLTVTKEEADTMKKDYNEKFVQSSAASRSLAPEAWVDGDVIVAFDDLLQKSNRFDGVRFINSSEIENGKTTINIIPTVIRDRHDSGVSDHVNNWTKISTAPGHDPVFRGINKDSATTRTMENRFETQYTKNFQNDLCLSKTVWMGTCVIHALRLLIQAPNSEVNGVKVIFGAYRQKVVSSQKAINQSTIILVPTKGDTHQELWDIVKERIEFTYDKNAGFNHGELCPNACNADGSKK